MILQSFVLQERHMVLLQQTRFDKLEQISHYKFIHNPRIYSPRATYSKPGWMKALDPISNLEKDILELHTSHLKYMKTYKNGVPSTPSLVGYPGWMK